MVTFARTTRIRGMFHDFFIYINIRRKAWKQEPNILIKMEIDFSEIFFLNCGKYSKIKGKRTILKVGNHFYDF